MFISKKKKRKKSHLKKKTHIYRTFTARARTCGRAVDLPHVRLCRAASLMFRAGKVHTTCSARIQAACVDTVLNGGNTMLAPRAVVSPDASDAETRR